MRSSINEGSLNSLQQQMKALKKKVEKMEEALNKYQLILEQFERNNVKKKLEELGTK